MYLKGISQIFFLSPYTLLSMCISRTVSAKLHIICSHGIIETDVSKQVHISKETFQGRP